NWASISAAHRDQVGLPTTPSGQHNHDNYPTVRFPAGVDFTGFSALSDALIGRRPWSDPDDIREAGIVLGSDDGAAWALINKVRQAMVDKWESAYNTMME